ncbi:4a-hydroxytetrahydrobiopterin dehydratase [Pelolinea submarina]|uniref:Putative pterin-4-alpha-carbinolamine dehydratase n=1 Tax=Pelolinea submarina TaxID=913107 RepID=A0A347ZQ27_9CHLR|nr:4a-hydroxytetrahydrobiopterin dehydratase [Pelolinea submarina]REG06263.1 4a-hydroxytetrahydrobiopterin dehydratase [Pelolinea submarina]BBB47408.1 4a-hydroxytetrahydrobiopterin dehydratase [Pelolinea submarina]
MAMLAELKCSVCQAGDPSLTDAEITDLLKNVPDWQVIEAAENGQAKTLRRAFKFKDFLSALAFTNAVGQAAEQAGHHPALLTEWGRVTVTWWTHKIHGLHENDFIMAAKTDQLYTGES